MPIPIELNLPEKSNFANRPSVPANQKESAEEFNMITAAVAANYHRLVLYWDTDITTNYSLRVGQYVVNTNILYRIITQYNVGSPATWDPTKASAVGAVASPGEGLDEDGGLVKLGSDALPATNPLISDRFIQLNSGIGLELANAVGFSFARFRDNGTDGATVELLGQDNATLEYVALLLDMAVGAMFVDGRTIKKGIEYSPSTFPDLASFNDLDDNSLIPKIVALSLISGAGIIKDTYNDIAELLAEQGDQVLSGWYMVIDASADPTVDTGWAIYQKLVASTADLSDYMKIAEQESMDVSLNNANETDKGIVEEATQAEANAGTSTGGTGAKLFITPTKLLALAATFANQITFTTSPIVTALTASKFVKSGSSKELVTVDSATQAEALTGTDDTKPLTPLGLESKRSVKSVSISNGATGTTNIDCGLKQELHVVFNTTVTGGITITLSNDTNLEVMHISIPITGANIAITFPSSTRMARYFEVSSGDGWYQSTKILQVSSVDTADLHEFSLMRVDPAPKYKINYDGPARA